MVVRVAAEVTGKQLAFAMGSQLVDCKPILAMKLAVARCAREGKRRAVGTGMTLQERSMLKAFVAFRTLV